MDKIDWSKVDKDKILEHIKNYFERCKPCSSESVMQVDHCYLEAPIYMGFIVDEVWKNQIRESEE